ncbi:class 2 aldolase adducin domain containing protein [Grosmannia clavigera kw1407]|uniref:Methylthioribulose-1-phosphate dehydratase n=1 Tax=Grosmannia clavigera (strain kw1407 / UAMH 11150) TaxID=655863 RepID=F0X9G9_GROCL|nr:class 2 aldolase adducin domain containing protein [Grosmannia clavigera kw1407]EFX06088.1 class 2 aldolase adducin domain containing protein [Grosmannia clavigera kw1407]
MSGSTQIPAAAVSDNVSNNEHLVVSDDPEHPANLIPKLCAKFWTLGWVTGTGGGASIRNGDLVYLAPSGVQKELMKSQDIYVLSLEAQARYYAEQKAENDAKVAAARAANRQLTGPWRPLRTYLRSPRGLKPSQCTPLFLSAFTRRNAGCCIHTHSHWAVLVTLILEQEAESFPGSRREFRINNIEQIKGFKRGYDKTGNLGYHDTLCIPVIENTAHEEDLTEFLEAAIEKYPDTYAVLVRRHGVYVWGDSVHAAKTQCESLDYLFQLAVEMKQLHIPWISNVEEVLPSEQRSTD